MAKYLVAIHRADDFDASIEYDESKGREIDELNDEMVAAGVRVFVGGLQPVHTAVSLRRQADGGFVEVRGPYLSTREHVEGFWVLDVADLDEALAWGRKAAVACRASVEVRPFH